MKVRLFCFILLCLFALGCGDEGIETVLHDLGAAPPVQVAVREMPPEIQTLLFDRFGTRDELIARLADIEQGDDNWEDQVDWFVRVIAKMDQHRAFYTRYIDAGGIVIVGSADVDDAFFIAARDIVFQMTSKHPEIRDQLSPESHFYMALLHEYDATDQGLPNRLFQPPAVTPVSGKCGPYCISRVWYGPGGMLTFVHEFAHAVHFAINGEGAKSINVPLDATFDDRLKAAYATAMAAGKWEGNYASKNYREYWAVGVEYWYNLSRAGAIVFASRAEFAAYDPLLYELLSEWFFKDTFDSAFWGDTL